MKLQHALLLGAAASAAAVPGAAAHKPTEWAPSVPLPNQRQLDFMDMETIQFMHFGINTFWDPPKDYLYGPNPTYHDCKTSAVDHGNQTHGYYPCLNPDVFAPTDLNTDDWMQASAALGMKEICLTAKHEGGFALWPSNFTNYSVAASSWRDGSGDVLREFVDAAHRWGINICYYCNVAADGYLAEVANLPGKEFAARQIGMVKELLHEYGPVNRFWFDGTSAHPKDLDVQALWDEAYTTIRTESPATLISPYRGDVCASTGSLYTNSGPAPNSTDSKGCGKTSPQGKYFHPTEMHGITIQEGPDGNTDEAPTYWFWHPWACAKNITGCPWIGHSNASRIFDSYIATVGHGAVLNMNSPPERTGRMNASVREVMFTAGQALNDTFHSNHVAVSGPVQAPCQDGVAVLSDVGGAAFDYVVTMEDLTHGQRVGNYSVEYQPVGGGDWQLLVPPALANGSKPSLTTMLGAGLGDRPDGHDPRDQYVGHKRIDFPVVDTRAVKIGAVRFNCIASLAAPSEPVYLRSFSLHEKKVPWE